ncbi:MAG: BatA domain-containing protein [Gemmatimonas sp.]
MSWQNAWVLSGLTLLALPVLIHLLSQKRAVQRKFPSLRFLDVSRLLPTRSPNLTDIPLMLVRMLIVAMGVLALAQPLFRSQAREQSFNASLARVVVVDTSRSMQRALGASTVADSARRLATALASEASASVVLQTASPASVLRGAAAWLTQQSGRGEVVVVSDFQTGALSAQALTVVPSEFGVRAVRVGGSRREEAAAPMRTSRSVVTMIADSAHVQGEWLTSSVTEHSSVTVLSGAADSATARIAFETATTVVVPGIADTSRRVTIVLPQANNTAAVLAAASAPDARWMGESLLAVERDATLRAAALSTTMADTNIAAPFAVIAQNASGAPVVYAAAADVNGARQLIFVSRAGPATLAATALMAAVATSVAQPLDAAETATGVLSDAAIAAFEREPQSLDQSAGRRASAERQSGLSDGRWFWMAALALVGVESLMRRRTVVPGVAA